MKSSKIWIIFISLFLLAWLLPSNPCVQAKTIELRVFPAANSFAIHKHSVSDRVLYFFKKQTFNFIKMGRLPFGFFYVKIFVWEKNTNNSP